MILTVAIDTPLRRAFDYHAPAGVARERLAGLQPGVRVRVPFGRRQSIGVLVGCGTASSVAPEKLKAALEILDDEPLFDAATLSLLCFAADYYHHPIGEVFAAALPAAIRAGAAAHDCEEAWTLTPAGQTALELPAGRRAPRQREILERLLGGDPLADDAVQGRPARAALAALAARGFIRSTVLPRPAATITHTVSGVARTAAQQTAVDAITAAFGRYAAFLLHGVTGSGKTEVYMEAIAASLAGDGQALVLVPEIALTPQLVQRFRARFGGGIAVLHSGVAEVERRDAWRAARSGRARIVIGTRSAVFAPLARLGLVVVDEEHDASYKQQEGLRYSARDLAVLRAQRAQVPVVLGSATPSLETLENVAQGRYTRLSLPQRPGGTPPPRIRLIDLRRVASDHGLSQPALAAMATHLAAGGQVIAYLNRRGYAPCLYCIACGWVAPCAHCDARMVLHRRAARLRCHHCGASGEVPSTCGACGQPLAPVGQGTERVEETMARLFPDAPLARLDRDAVGSAAALDAVLARVRNGEARILVGTQMLTKGHDFPDVSLVVVLDADQGLFSSDFRASERLAQTITQVAGRAGRGSRPGEVLVQTAFPEHPLLTRLIAGGYEEFASAALDERREALWPPFSRLALLRAEARDAAALDAYLRAAAEAGRGRAEVEVLGPANALMARRADHYRAHLLVEGASRSAVQRFLADWLPRIERLPAPSGLRWSIDVDPLELD